MPQPEDLKKDEIAHLIALHRAAQPTTLLTYDQHYNAIMKLTKPTLIDIIRELELPTTSLTGRE